MRGPMDALNRDLFLIKSFVSDPVEQARGQVRIRFDEYSRQRRIRTHAKRIPYSHYALTRPQMADAFSGHVAV